MLLKKWSQFEWRELNNLIKAKKYDLAKNLLETAYNRTKNLGKKLDINNKLKCLDIIVKYNYEDANISYSEKFIFTEKDEKHGVLLVKDKHLLYSPCFQSIEDGFDQNDFILVQRENKYGILDTLGNIFLSVVYDEIDFDDFAPLIAVKLYGKYGLLNKSGKLVVKHTYTSLDPVWDQGIIIVEENDKYGLIDTLGRTLLPSQFDHIYGFEKNEVIVEVNKEEKRVKYK